MSTNLQPFLEDKLVSIGPLEASDIEILFQVAADPLIWEQHQDNQRHTLEGFTRFFEESMQSGTALKIRAKEEDKIIGSSRFKMINKAEGVVEIGWTFIARQYWGGHYNRSIKRLMVNYALLYFEKVVFYVNVNNIRSQRAMEKTGCPKN